jgi:hypothetical protein
MVPKDQDFWEYLQPQREAFKAAPVGVSNGKVATNGHAVAGEPHVAKQPV